MLHLLANARIFAPEDLGVRHILVGGSRILAIDDDLERLRCSSATELDIEGRRLIPGLIDGHAHITGGGGESGFSSRVPPVQPSRFTSAGVTSVVGVLGTDDTTRQTRELVATAYALREHGMGAWCHTGGYHVPPVTLTGSVRDDIVFVEPILGVGELAISDHRSSQPSLEEVLRIASDAHVAGLIADKAGVLHLHLGDGERALELVRRALDESELPARVFNPTHINRRSALYDEALKLAEHGCVVDITAFPVEDGDDALAAEDALLNYLDAGAPASNITVSSDGGGCLPVFDADGRITSMDIGQPSSLADTLAACLAAGADLHAVLPAFTSNVADLLRLHDRGRICHGSVADLVVLDENDAIRDVMATGTWHRREGRQLVYGDFETAPTADST